MVDRFDPPRDLDWKPLPMRPDIAGQYVRYSDLTAAHAEIERLTKERDRFRDEAKAERLVQGALREKAEAERDEALSAHRIELDRRIKAEADRDEARAQGAFSQMEMRDKAAKLCSWHSETLVTTIKRLPVSIDAKAALEAYGREKVREGMQRAAGVARECWDDPPCEADAEYIPNAILADMEKLK